jgi:hypothetical protein
LKIRNIKRAGGAAQGVGPEFKPQYGAKKKKSIFKSRIQRMDIVIQPVPTQTQMHLRSTITLPRDFQHVNMQLTMLFLGLSQYYSRKRMLHLT